MVAGLNQRGTWPTVPDGLKATLVASGSEKQVLRDGFPVAGLCAGVRAGFRMAASGR